MTTKVLKLYILLFSVVCDYLCFICNEWLWDPACQFSIISAVSASYDY